jgi:hypothetical protein
MEPYLAVIVVPDSRSFRMHEGLRPGSMGPIEEKRKRKRREEGGERKVR